MANINGGLVSNSKKAEVKELTPQKQMGRNATKDVTRD